MTRLIWGTISFSSSSRFGASSGAMFVKPVTLPPGRVRLSTRPILSGYADTAMTIGIAFVTDFAARTA